MKIEGLTIEQVALLDEMWDCDSLEEFEEFIETLGPTEKIEAHRLQRLVLLETLDDDMKDMCEYPSARKVLVDIMYK
jgi:hypothetical protein